MLYEQIQYDIILCSIIYARHTMPHYKNKQFSKLRQIVIIEPRKCG